MRSDSYSRLAVTARSHVRRLSGGRIPSVHSHILVLVLLLVFGFWFFSQAHAQSVLQPVASWNLEEGSGTTITDNSGNGHNGTIINPTWQSGASCQGSTGTCLNFQPGSRVDIENQTTLLNMDYSISVWLNFVETADLEQVVGTYNNSSANMAGIMNFPGPNFLQCIGGQWSDPTGFAEATRPANWEGTWHHITCTRASTGILKLYFDGVLVATNSNALAGNLALQFNSYLRFDSAEAGVSNPPYSQTLDNVKIYNVTLSDAQVTELYTTGQVTQGGGGSDTTAPTPPTTITPSGITSSSFHLTWSGATDNNVVAGYRVDVSTVSNFASFVSGWNNNNVGNVTQTDVNSLSANTTYYVRIRSYDPASNVSANSSTANTTTLAASDTTPPSVPTNVSATGTSAKIIHVTWTASTDNVAVTGYRMDVSTVSNFSSFVTNWNNADVNNVTQIDVGGLTTSTTYYTRIRAYDAAGNTSTNSSTASGTTTNGQAQATTCGNGILESGEQCDGELSQSCTINGYSGNQLCNTNTCLWGTCSTTQSCGDGTCNGAETNAICPQDCSVPTLLCGNGTLNSGEVCDPPGAHSCTTGGYTGSFSCSSDCSSQGTCTTSQYCGDSTCNGLENYTNCANDCAAPSNGPTCGNNTCESGEYCYSCPGDCGSCGSPSSNQGSGSTGGTNSTNPSATSTSSPPVTPASVIVTDTVHVIKDAASGASTPIVNTSNWIVETSGAAVGGVFTLFCLVAGFVSDFLFRHLRFNQNTQDNRWKYQAVRVAVGGVFFFLPLITGFTTNFTTGIIFAVLETVSFWGFSKVMARISAKAGNFAVPTIEQVK